MPVLKMFLGNVLLDKTELDYGHLETVVDRVLYQKRMYDYLYWLHYEEVGWRKVVLPEFVIDDESKMNDREYFISDEEMEEFGYMINEK
jgi:hypothetical protein